MKKSDFQKKILCRLWSYLPRGISDELSYLTASGAKMLSEVSIRACGVSSAVINGRNKSLSYRLQKDELEGSLRCLLGGSLYAHRDTLCEGYISDGLGIRVGVVADARYDAERLVGISGVRSLVFRLPLSESTLAEPIFSIWQKSRTGLVIYSLPGAGKTSALRSLASLIAKSGVRAVVVDERYEFFPENFLDTPLDILRGYRKEKGIEIAARSLSAEVILIDEIATEGEARAILSAAMTGVPVIATAHADSLCTLKKREGLRRLIEVGCFRKFIRLYREGEKFFLEEETE